MSNYSPIVSYGPKDALPHLDPNKAIKGVQIDAELNAIATAIATKVDGPLQNVTINGSANTYGLTVIGSGTAGQSVGLRSQAGTNGSDWSAAFLTKDGTSRWGVRGDGRIMGGVSNFVDITPSAGTFNASLSGPFTVPIVVTCTWVKYGSEVTLHVPRISGAAPISGTATITAAAGTIPVAIIPTASTNAGDHTQMFSALCTVFSGNTILWGEPGNAHIGSDGAFYIIKATNWATITNNGVLPFSMRYLCPL